LQKVSGLKDPFFSGLIGLIIFFIYFITSIYSDNEMYNVIIAAFQVAGLQRTITESDIWNPSFLSTMGQVASSITIAYLISVILCLVHILKDIPALANISAEIKSKKCLDKSSSVQLSKLKYRLKDGNFSSSEEIPNDNSEPSIVDDILFELKSKFSNKLRYYSLIFLILISFIIMDIWFFIVRPDNKGYLAPENQMNFIKYLCDNFITYFMEYLIAIIIWIIINIYSAFKWLSAGEYRQYILIDPFSIDGIGGLGKARDSTKRIAICYFTCLTLAIITYTIPLMTVIHKPNLTIYLAQKILYLEQIFAYIILLIIGLYFIYNTYFEIKNIFKSYLLEKISIISKIQDQLRANLHMKCSEINKNANSGEIKDLSSALELVDNDKENLIQIAKKSYSLSTIATIMGSFVGSLIIPILSMIQLIQGILQKPH